MVSRAEAQVAALVALLKTLPDAHLAAVLDGLGIAQERRQEAHRDPRICSTCGFGWVRHKALSDHPQDGHAWAPRTSSCKTQEATE